jgi:hypothetical protein
MGLNLVTVPATPRLPLKRSNGQGTFPSTLRASTFSGVLTVLGLPGDFLFSVDPVALRLEIHSKIVFRSGTDAF